MFNPLKKLTTGKKKEEKDCKIYTKTYGSITNSQKNIKTRNDKANLTIELNESNYVLSGCLTSPVDNPLAQESLQINARDGLNSPEKNIGYTTTDEKGNYKYQIENQYRDCDEYSAVFNFKFDHPDYSNKTVARTQK